MHHFKAMGELKLELQSVNSQFGSKSAIFCPAWPWNLTDDLENNRAPLLCCFNFCASCHGHQRIQTRVTVRKRSIWVKIDAFFPCDLEISQMTLKNNRAPFLCYFELCESFCSHWWIQSITVWKRPIWVKMDDFLALSPWNLTDDLDKQ